MAVAEVVARRSTCARLSVGAVLTDIRMEQLWYGYNGGAKGGVNECRHGPDSPGGCGCLHAEMNAVIKAPGDIAKLAFLTHSPCAMCATMLVNAHVAEVYYGEEYRDIEGLMILADAGIRVQGRPADPRDYVASKFWKAPCH